MPLLQSLRERYLLSIKVEMEQAVVSARAAHDPLFDILRYHLGWVDEEMEQSATSQGKHVRPILCLLACEACGADWRVALPAAAAVELVHNFSLIHDDIEDGDATRRGRPTVWRLWGEAQAINAGDAMYAVAQLALLQLAPRGVPAQAVIEAAALFNRTCLAITEGQFLDIGFEAEADISIEDYLVMVEGKTAALAACGPELGALIADSLQEPSSPGRQRRDALRAFGFHLGVAFQIQDDILGIWGDRQVTGKPVGADILRRKKSLPMVHGLRHSKGFAALMGKRELTEADLSTAIDLLEETGSRRFAEDLALQHHRRSIQALDCAHVVGAAGDELRGLAEELLERTW